MITTSRKYSERKRKRKFLFHSSNLVNDNFTNVINVTNKFAFKLKDLYTNIVLTTVLQIKSDKNKKNNKIVTPATKYY